MAQDEAEAQPFLRGEHEPARTGEVEHTRVRREFGDDRGEASALEGLVHGPQHVFGAGYVEVDECRCVKA
ncbi:MAG: hypothetical protein ACK559_14560 [bacterium]